MLGKTLINDKTNNNTYINIVLLKKIFIYNDDMFMYVYV